MHTQNFRGFFRLGIAAIVLAAVVTQFIYGFQFVGYNPLNFFRFFTIESNVFAAGVFVLSGLAAIKGERNQYPLLRGAATVYMTLTGIVYSLLLTGVEVQTSIPWVNSVLHYVMPVVVFVDWFLDVPKVKISFKQSIMWLIYPFAYLVFSLIAGLLDGWYPYPFLNPGNHGYGAVSLVSLVIALVVFGLAQLFRFSAQKRS